MKKRNFLFLLIGTLFGITLMKSDAVSWFRMQEMFRFQGFQIFGIFITAVATSVFGIFIIKKFKIKTLDGEPVIIKKKTFNMGYVYGSLLFGVGWGLTGACPGPIYVQIGSGLSIAIVTLLSAMAGTWVYSYLKPRLPH
ncbi:MAG TPA: DUF6691 family protein [Hanamia sp.]|nr:DUF6691 family protein [Hanamia sp.]